MGFLRSVLGFYKLVLWMCFWVVQRVLDDFLRA